MGLIGTYITGVSIFFSYYFLKSAFKDGMRNVDVGGVALVSLVWPFSVSFLLLIGLLLSAAILICLEVESQLPVPKGTGLQKP